MRIIDGEYPTGIEYSREMTGSAGGASCVIHMPVQHTITDIPALSETDKLILLLRRVKLMRS